MCGGARGVLVVKNMFKGTYCEISKIDEKPNG